MRRHAYDVEGVRWLGCAALLVGCHAQPRRPHAPPATSLAIEVGGSVRAVAADELAEYVATVTGSTTKLEAFHGTRATWSRDVEGAAAALTRAGELVVLASAGDGGRADNLRGDPAALAIALDRKTGTERWRLAFDSTAWSVVSSLAAAGNDVIVGGLFAGTLRAGTHVVSSAGGSDGFVARVSATGEVVWLARIGGAGADGVQGVAARGATIAIAGTFTAGAELLGASLAPYDERSPFGDGFVAALDGNGARRWFATFGGRYDDVVAGVAIDELGNTIVAATVHDVIKLGDTELAAQGEGDGLVAWYSPKGAKRAAMLLGGLDNDGLRAITAAGDQAIVGGFFSGAMQLGNKSLRAAGSDDAFVAALDPDGTVATSWHVTGVGREEIAALATVYGGFVAGIRHTAAATIDRTALAAPADPLAGSALIVRGIP